MTGGPGLVAQGIVCTGETYTKVVKVTLAQGVSISDPIAPLKGNARRAIDTHEGEKVDARAFQALVKAAGARMAEGDYSFKPTRERCWPKKSNVTALVLPRCYPGSCEISLDG